MWKKGNEIFNGRLVINGRVSFISGEPPAELMRSLGWEEYVPPAPEPPPKRYSKLKIIRKLGAEAWEAKKASLVAVGLWDEFDQASWLEETDATFAAVYATLTDEEKRMLDEECVYE